MGTYTTKLLLFKPSRVFGNDDIVSLTADVTSEEDTLDTHISMRIVTSSTRPTQPYQGMLIFETDTGNVMLFSGLIWRQYGTDKLAQGFKSRTETGGDGATLNVGSAENKYIQTTFTAQSDRRYCVEIGAWVERLSGAVGLDDGLIRVRWASGATVAITDTLISSASIRVSAPIGTGSLNAEHVYGLYNFIPAVTGNVTVGLFMLNNSGTAQILFDGAANKINFIQVRDVGV